MRVGAFVAKSTKSRQTIQSPHPCARPARPKENNKRKSQPKTEGSQMICSNFRVPFGLRLLFYRNWLLCEPPGGFSLGIGHSWSLFWLPKWRPRHILTRARAKIAKNRPKCRLKRAKIAKNVTSPHARDGGKSPQSLTRRTNLRCLWGPFSGKSIKSRPKNGIATSSRPGSAAKRAQQTQFLT